jgi:hypothetical protein
MRASSGAARADVAARTELAPLPALSHAAPRSASHRARFSAASRFLLPALAPPAPGLAAPMAALGAFLSEAAAAVQRQDGAGLAALLAVGNARASAAVADALRTQPTLDVAALASQRLQQPYDEVRGRCMQPVGPRGSAENTLCSSARSRACALSRLTRFWSAGARFPLPGAGGAGAG